VPASHRYPPTQIVRKSKHRSRYPIRLGI
jgi:hypothetical protein